MRELIERAGEVGGLPAEDLVAVLLPLLRDVAALHETGLVAPLRGLAALGVDADGAVVLDHTGVTAPTRNRDAISALEHTHSAALDVSRRLTIERDLSSGTQTSSPAPTSADEMRIVPGWQRWEHALGHHDELTDIASLGELLAALACGLDLADDVDAHRLDVHQRNLFALNPRIHPVVAAAASAMIASDRRRRTQDLAGTAERIETYRDQPEDLDLDRVVSGRSADRLLTHLRNRLFDVSRRNPLLHFRRTQRSLNLTEASVPLVLDVRNVRAEQLFTWGGAASRRLVAGRSVDLGAIVRWTDAPYASAALDALISTARRDRAEYGQDQLRLVAAFLRWHDVKNDPDTEIVSPLILAPVTLAKKRGVRDSHRLQLVDTVAEVNPVLRHHLADLFGLALPETLDLAGAGAIDGLRETLERQARATQPGLSVTLVERPRIELVRHRALLAMQSYRRRRGGTRAAAGSRHYAYSYTRPGWAPLGVQIFADRVRAAALPISTELGDAPVPRQAMSDPAGSVLEKDTFALGAGDANPYAWEVDLCSVTLANFNYRTLSLVRDYDTLADEPRANGPFDEMFSSAPRDVPPPSAPIAPDDAYLVVAADGSQLGALAQSRTGDNFVIQGPPGTGKSQTITNLIADYLARGARVLFVCQKRAALDVVHARLRAQGLDEVCTLVHDSQADKKAFVHGLRDTYESWLADTVPIAAVEQRRNAVLAELAAVLREIGEYEDALLAAPDGVHVGALLERLIALRDARWGDELTPAHQRLIPGPREWSAARPAVTDLCSALERASGAAALAASPVRVLDPAILDEGRVDAVVADRSQAALPLVDDVLATLGAGGGNPGPVTLERMAAIVDRYATLAPLVDRGAGAVLDPSSRAADDLRAAGEHARAVAAAADTAAAAAAGWRDPLDEADARAALEVARRREPSGLRWLHGDWRRVRDLVRARLDTSGRQVPPTATQALELLVARYDTAAALAAERAASARSWGHEDAAALAERVAAMRRDPSWLASWRDRVVAAPATFAALPEQARRLHAATAGLVVDTRLPDLRDALAALATPGGQGVVRAAAPALRVLATRPAVLAALRELDASPDQLDYAVAAAAVRDARAGSPTLERLDGDRLGDLVAAAHAALPALRRANAEVITARLRDRFATAVAHSQRSVTGMDADGRARKKTWAAGRRELEHEFGKVRAYKSIRQLASGDAGAVTAALRPVWLMSPASLSDTLPLEAGFDVVVFDEASQVPVEEAVPALFRGRQVIVVGDRMQLPPTQYFRTRAPDQLDDEEGADVDFDDDDERVGVVLDADSFLGVGSVRLPSTLLRWHYRSRYEALIQFSNAAFYEGRLATIPDRDDAPLPAPPLEYDSTDTEQVSAAVDAVLARSISVLISVLRLRDGLYERRTNRAEAAWIAELVRELLARETGQTIGIVAFSEAQQGEIERALETLSAADAAFARRYEAELTREEDGQAVGLFVKNLENVQGDERDIVIMSVCYGLAPDGRMRMNFGPINNAGGEKRLNVIFSRSRQHMVLVTSIDHTAITNTYNDGANTLRQFLRYAQAVSQGDEDGARTVLGSVRDTTEDAAPVRRSPVVDQLAGALRDRGLDVETDVGQSSFRCDLAVRAQPDGPYSVAVVVDDPSGFATAPIDERRVIRPAALASAGWRVVQVLGTEWEARPDAVVERIRRLVG